MARLAFMRLLDRSADPCRSDFFTLSASHTLIFPHGFHESAFYRRLFLFSFRGAKFLPKLAALSLRVVTEDVNSGAGRPSGVRPIFLLISKRFSRYSRILLVIDILLSIRC